MKQKLTFIWAFIVLISAANAQMIGIKTGLSLANTRYEKNEAIISISNLAGLHFGLIGEIPLYEEVFFNSGILLSQKGTKMSLFGVEIKFPVNYLEIPLNLAYKHDLGNAKLFAQAGPYTGVGLSAKMKGNGDDEKMDFGSQNNQIKRLDLGVNFGAGFEIKPIQVGINYGLGLTNLSNDPDESMKNRVLSLSVALFFRKLKIPSTRMR